MKKMILATMLLGSMVARADEPVFPFPIQTRELSNGLKVACVPMDSPGVVAFYTVVRTGSRNEVEAGHTGFAHFFEHMMFRGTERYSDEKYNETLRRMGADNNAFTTEDYTAYHTVAPSSELETIFDMESDRFMNLSYSVDAFRKEAGAVLGEYNKSTSSPWLTIEETLLSLAFKQHTYRHSVIGFIEDIKSMPNQYEYSLDFFRKWYRPDNAILLVVGDAKPERVFALAEKYHGAWKRGAAAMQAPQEPPQEGERRAAIEFSSSTLPILTVSYRGPAFSDTEPDLAALDLVAQMALSESSPLYERLVVEERKVEELSGGAQDMRDPGLFTVYAKVKDAASLGEVETAIQAAFDKIADGEIDAKRLEEVKSHMRYSFAMSLDSPGQVAYQLVHYLGVAGDPAAVNRVHAIYARLTPEDLRKAASAFLTVKHRNVVVLTEKGGAR